MIRGVLFTLASALFFSIGSVLVKVVANYYPMPATQLTCIRFFVGFAGFWTYFLIKRQWPRLKTLRFVFLRGAFNTVAIFLFMWSLTLTTVTKANMLNMTFPVYVFILAPFVNKELFKKIDLMFLLLTLTGVYLVVSPDFKTIVPGDMIAAFSGVCAGFGAVFLREAKKTNPVPTILLVLYTIGFTSMLTASFFSDNIPTVPGTLVALLSGFFGVIGQITFSKGMQYLTAPTGSLLSTTRILVTAIMGVIIFHDPITPMILIGASLITVSLVGISGFFSKKRKLSKNSPFP